MSPIEAGRKRLVRVAPLVPLTLAAIAGIVVDRYLDPCSTLASMGVAIGFASLGLLVHRRPWFQAVAILVATTALAGGWHHCHWSDVAANDVARAITETPRPVWLRGVIRERLGYRRGRWPGDQGITRAVLDITAVRNPRGWQTASGRAALTIVTDRSDLNAGTVVEGAGNLSLVAAPLNPGESDYRTYLRAQGIRLRMSIGETESLWHYKPAAPPDHRAQHLAAQKLDAVRSWAQATLEKRLDNRVAPLASALVLGRREAVDPDVNDAFARTGTAHLLAISGLHMQVLALFLDALLILAGVRSKTSYAIVGAATLLYMVLVGLMPSVVRSAVMTCTYCCAGFIARKGRPSNTMALAALVTLGINPSYLFDVGFQLSFLAVGTIVWCAGPLAFWLTRNRRIDPLDALEREFEPDWKHRLRRAGAWVVEALVLSTVVWLATLPLVALRFHLISPIGVLLNLALIPITSLALLAAGLGLCLAAVWEPLGIPASWIGGILLQVTEWVVSWGARQRWGYLFVPEPSWIWVLGFYVLISLSAAAIVSHWRGWLRHGAVGLTVAWTAIGLGLALAPAAATRPDSPPKAEVLAVGHGLAVLIETGNRRGVLYDCGRMRDPAIGRRVIAPALWARGIKRLDAVVLSHADADHYDGLPDLLDRIAITAVLVPPGFATEANPGTAELLALIRSRGIAVRTISEGDFWSAGATRFTVRHPPSDMNPAATDNARSIVLDVSWRGRHALLTGDLEREGLSRVTNLPVDGPIDALVAPHHGARAANPPWLYSWAEPALVVVSQRPPPLMSRDALAKLRMPVLRTWKSGAIRLTWTQEGIAAHGFKNEQDPYSDESDPGSFR